MWPHFGFSRSVPNPSLPASGFVQAFANAASQNTSVHGVTNTVWDGTSNLTGTNDGNYNNSTVTTDTKALKFLFPSLSVPSGKTIAYITFDIWRNGSSGPSVYDAEVYIVKGGSVQVSPGADGDGDDGTGGTGAFSNQFGWFKTTTWNANSQMETYGNDLWGLSWVSADFNTAGQFGFWIAAASTGVNGTAQVDAVRATVGYQDIVAPAPSVGRPSHARAQRPSDLRPNNARLHVLH